MALKTDGSFYITHMYDFDSSQWAIAFASLIKNPTGEVYFWNVDEVFSSVTNTTGSFPNGIDLDVNEENLYINYWFSGKTIKFDLRSAQTLAVHTGGRADNLTLSNGSLWAAKHDMSLTDFFEKCPPETTNCFLPFSIHKFDSDLNELKTWSFESSTFGFATVATPVGENVWIGTAHGDRIASFKISPQ